MSERGYNGWKNRQTMTLYRATFLRHGSTLAVPAYRLMTFAAKDDATAARDAQVWMCGDKLLSVTALWALQPQLTLTHSEVA